MKRPGTLARYAAVSLLWGSTWLTLQAVGEQAQPLAAGALRFALAALVLLPFFRRQPRAHFRHAAVLGLSMLAAPYCLLVWAGSHGSAGWTPLVYAALPLLAASDGWRPAMILAIGSTFLVLNGSLPLSVGKALWAAPILLAAGLQAVSIHYARRHLPTLASIAMQFTLAALLLAGGSLAFEATPRLCGFSAWPVGALLSVLALALLGTALPYALYYRLLGDLTPAQAASTQWLQFVVTVLESAWIFHQRPAWLMVAGMAALCACAARLLFREGTGDVTIRLTPG